VHAGRRPAHHKPRFARRTTAHDARIRNARRGPKIREDPRESATRQTDGEHRSHFDPSVVKKNYDVAD
jgi:hypothetical protein